MTMTLSMCTARSERSRRENAEGKLGAKGGQTRGNSREENKRVCATTPNNDDEQSCQAGDLPQTTDGHGDSNPIPTVCANIILSRLTCSRPRHFATRQLSIQATKTSLQFTPCAICLRSCQVHKIRGAAFNAARVVFNPMSHANPPAQDHP
jgi:hypothetical protein